MILLMLSVMIGGQYLMTTTIEEKSSRVVEVLLSAVSPMQLMTGKVIGQLLVGLTLLVIYSGLGTGILGVFSLGDLLHPLDLVYLFVFFLLAYFMFGSLMAAVGAAVNDVREAQALMMPVILLIIIPYFLWFPISRDPNSVFSTTLSFIPPVSPFVIMMRIASTSPPPAWQILLAIVVNMIGAFLCLRITAKVFRVGLLMFGKPPNFKTLIHWIRMA
jgi:ABC-2 type transport system permease protein